MEDNDKNQDNVDFQQYWLILKRRWLPAAFVVGSVFGLTAFVTFQQKPIYEAEGKLLFNKNNRISALSGLNAQIGELAGVSQLSNPLDTEAEVIRSYPILQKTITKFNLKDKQGKPLKVEEFLKLLKVKSVKGTDILGLSYRSTNSQEAANVVNSLMGDYIENNIRVNTAEARAAREFLSKQLPEVERKVVQAEAQMRRFKDENNVVSLEAEAKVGVESLKDLLSQITEAQAGVVDANTRSGALKSQLELSTQEAVELSTLSQSPGVQQVLTEYQKVQDELAVARTRLTNEHPTIVNLVKKEEALQKQLEGRVTKIAGSSESVPEQNLQIGLLKQNLTVDLVKSEVERLAMADRLADLRKSFLVYQGRLRIIPKLEQKQRALERRLQVAQGTYQQVFKKLQEVEVVEKQTIGNVRVISSALIPDKPVSPKIPLNLALGGFLGILLGAGTALILEAMDRSLKTVEEAKRLVDYPLLGTVPQFKKKVGGEGGLDLPVLNNPYTAVSAAFEMLQANLGFTLFGETVKVIVVSSSVPGEGKSFVSANLAVALAQLGRRVLLVDADMRRPRQHAIWELSNLMGLSNVIAGQAEYKSVTNEALVTLDVLTSGTIPPNPLALLESQQVRSLIAEVAQDYDFVIIDAPPLTAVPDGLVLGKQADGMLLVVRPGVANTDSIRAAKNQLENSGQKVLGIVVNGVTNGSGYGGYYTQGYYGGQGSEKNKNHKVEMPYIEVSPEPKPLTPSSQARNGKKL
ncbi:MAG: polysaccharide biosynthesis tyrosine autokinase [Cyanomargarita calcarea GSE-NOS-MK-12-04C]|jgi:capsular exopolysaccharide synthesis family protein|uniref:non-specific protein-tyrosine kinase n=1 Tax=Cyanomargarita calcarea GSE-NOS-MK-12-04C TaxID=2839659 RepID=A0A951QQJ3_9CYAN|nr:polysaccharide biosynthesis tyrosine autokinase [Cyanomargarita calcarea GSE-NOS-MK-12-04C]